MLYVNEANFCDKTFVANLVCKLIKVHPYGGHFRNFGKAVENVYVMVTEECDSS